MGLTNETKIWTENASEKETRLIKGIMGLL